METNKIYHGDCFEIMKNWPDGCVDIIITDPPYNIIVNDWNKGSGFYKKTNHLAVIKDSFTVSFDPLIYIGEMLRVSRNGVIEWISQSLLPTMLNYAKMNKLKWDIMFWHKTNACPAHYNHLMSDTEYGLRLYRPGAYFNNELDYSYYHKYHLDTVQTGNGHPTPKPLALMHKQIAVFSREGDLVCDPFCGSGTTLVAAEQSGRKWIGIDICESFCKLSQQRMEVLITGVPVRERRAGQKSLFEGESP